MPTVQRWLQPLYRGAECVRLESELSTLLEPCTITVYEVPDEANHPGEDLLEFIFDNPPADLDLDAAIAAFPRIPDEIQSPTVVMTANSPVALKSIGLARGDHVCLGIFVHASIAVAQGTRDAALDGTVIVWRETSGTVRVAGPRLGSVGQIPGFDVEVDVIQVDNDVVGVTLEFVSQAAGTMTIINWAVTERSRGRIA